MDRQMMEKEIAGMCKVLNTLTMCSPEWNEVAERLSATRRALDDITPREEFFSVDSGVHRTIQIKRPVRRRR